MKKPFISKQERDLLLYPEVRLAEMKLRRELKKHPFCKFIEFVIKNLNRL